MLEAIELGMHTVISACVYLMEAFGVLIIMVTAFRCFRKWVRHMDHVRLELGRGIALALQFKLAGEVLRTVVVRTWQEMGILGATIVLRAAITFLIHWEIHNEESRDERVREYQRLKAQRTEAAEAAQTTPGP